jgi:uncharacterized membrane protein
MHKGHTGAGILLLAAVSAVISLYAYPFLPDMVVSHWSASGMPDGYTPKILSTVFMPLLLVILFVVWRLIPLIEPMQKNFKTFEDEYNGFCLVMAFFLFYVYDLTLGVNLGWQFNFNVALGPALALLFYATAELLLHTKRNFFVGIRTPWTLSSDRVWKKTHEAGAYLFYLCAISALAGTFYPEQLWFFVLTPIIATVGITVLASYIEYRHVAKK